ncbi:MAG TPA: GWxTD domain-containing protein [bacterium]
MLPKSLTNLFVLLTFLTFEISNTSATDLYQRGIAQRDSGNWQAALDTWWTAMDTTRTQIKPDPRIGCAFIELTTQKQATDYYDKANDMYFWGISCDVSSFKDELRDEIDRISPLLREEIYEVWPKLLKDADPALTKNLRGFWVSKDPIPSTTINERLIEHWERIAHVREKYKNENTTVYGCDDRGLVFVKFGAPDQSYRSNFGSDQLEIMRWIDDFMLRQEVQRFNNNPDFEIWIYKTLKKNESTIFIFGKKDGFAKYGLRSGVEELIPERAFRRSSTQTLQGILPGAMLQLMYYSQLVLVDPFYLERYRELEALWANARAGGKLSPDYEVVKSLVSHFQNVDKATVEFEYMPTDRTDALEGLEPLDMKYYSFRYLDRLRHSRLCLMAVSTTQSYEDIAFTSFFAEEKSSKFKYRHILLSYDENWNIKERLVDYSALKNFNTSLFNITQGQLPGHYTLVSEKVLLDVRKSDLELADIPDTAKVIGLGTAFLGEISPLSPDSTQFEMSDLLIGVETTNSVEKELNYPFPVIPRRTFKRLPTLSVYLEIYFLINQPTLNLLCEIKRFKAKGKSDKLEETTAKMFTFDTTDRSMKRTLEIDIKKLIPGDYELLLKVTNKGTKNTQTRKAYFQISN